MQHMPTICQFPHWVMRTTILRDAQPLMAGFFHGATLLRMFPGQSNKRENYANKKNLICLIFVCFVVLGRLLGAGNSKSAFPG